MKKILHSGFIVLLLLAQVAMATEVSPTPVTVKAVSKVAKLNLFNRFFNKRVASGTLQDEEKMYSSNKITISAIYPNPASTKAAIKYELSDEAVKAKVVLCNVLGNIVGEYALSKETKQLDITTQDFASGVYFYTLNVDNKNVITRRLIIKHN
jgi:hypothetical protein